jgi:4-amino-4-deoxy-L-arabinose transferase-like glycosyltransferase
MEKRLIENVNKILHTPKWLFVLLLIVLILRIPSFFEPYSYGDEMIYLSLGEAIKRGIPLYSQIHDNKPPLLYIMAAIAGNLFWFRAILAIWHSATVFLFWKLTRALFTKNKKLQVVSTAVFALLTTLPLLEGNIANAELFMVGPTIAAFLILLTGKLNPKNLIVSGILFSIATLFKVPAAFDIPAIVFLWLVVIKKFNTKAVKNIVINIFFLALGFAAPIALTFIWYTLRGAFNEYLIAAFLQNVGYLSSWRPDDVAEPFLTKNGPLLLRAAIVAIGSLILFWKRKKLSKQFIFITIWLLLSLFAVSLSERPYPHYLIQSVPAISLLVGMLLTLENLEQSLTIIPLTLAFLVPVYYKFWYYPTTPYYTRFVKFATGKITKNEYFSLFGGHILRNYKIANYILASTKRNEKVFVWGNSSMIYALSRRLPPGKYVADYHIKDFSSNKEVIAILKADMPSFIVILPSSKVFTELSNLINRNYGLVETMEKATIWKLLDPQVRKLLK